MECWGLSKRKSSWLYWSLMLIHFLMVWSTQGACIEEERKALLEIKASHITSFDSSSMEHFLPTWVDYGSINTTADGGGDCCDWEMVSCNITTGHVTEIFLYSLVDDNSKLPSRLWPLNVSLFLHFKELTSLTLSSDFLDKETTKTGLERLSSLKKLEVLDLSWNLDIDNGILPSLTRITSLKILNLNHTSLNGNFSISDFAALENLEKLYLTNCYFNGTSEIQGSERVSMLRKLKTLNLSSNKFNESIITSLSTLSSLTNLDLSFNRFSGPFPAQELSHLTNLEEVDLSSTMLNDTPNIQTCISLSRLKRLERIALINNVFNNSIVSCLSALPSLKILDLTQSFSSRSSFPFQEFHNFPDLKVLLLGMNEFNGTLPMEAFASLNNLEVLDLSYNNFVGSVPSAIHALSSLRAVSFAFNKLNGSLPDHGLCQLQNLQELDLSNNMLDGILPQCFNGLSSLKLFDISLNQFTGVLEPSLIANLTSLEYIDFSHNNFEGSLSFSSFSDHSKLEVVRFLSDNVQFEVETEESIDWIPTFQLKVFVVSNCNNLNGSLADHVFCESKNLHELDLSINMLNGSLPRCFDSLQSLKLLDISSNQFSGTLMPSLIANLTSLQYIDFSHNKFEGSFSFSSFSNHTKLEVVRFKSDNDKFEVETEEPIDWIPMFQLKVLALSNCNINMHKGHAVPGFLLHQHKLQELDMSHNSLKGHFPSWLIENNTNLQVLILRNNSFDGISLHRNANMKWLDLSGNHMKGTIPSCITKLFPNINRLNMSRNALRGAIPPSIGDLSRLQVLDLSDNELSGEVPKGLLTNLSYLDILKLSNNKLHGQVLSGNLSWGNLKWVYLDSNQFTGKFGIKSRVEKVESLDVLDISNNFFTGVIPNWISNMSKLSELVVRNNSFEGRFPCGTAHFSFLDISQNSFCGPIPSCLNFENMEHLHLGFNRFTGWIPNYFRNLSQVLTLDIGHNKLSGEIPKFIGELSYLRILLLRNNNFSGSIPEQLCQLSNVSLMDLSSNSLSGSIPSCLQNITGPRYLAFFKRMISQSFTDFTYVDGSDPQSGLSTNFYPEATETRDEVQFTTKSLFLHYKGDILDYMAGLDFSCNKLTGEIPEELGLLTQIRALNLSHNQLTGPIPVNFSNLAKIESLDLSSNGLTGNVPSELIQLTFLSAFNVSHNNLSGRLPNMKQFRTFSEASYEGNPLLCGLPLKKKCTTDSQVVITSSVEEDNEKWFDIDMTCFYWSSSSTFVVFLLGFFAILYVNPYWRRRWLDGVEECMYTCHHFLYDSVRKLCMSFHK